MELKVVGWLAAGVAVGFVLGGIAPRRQVQRLESDLARLEERLSERERENPLSAFLPRLGAASGRRPGPEAPPPSMAPNDDRTAADGAAGPGASPGSDGRQPTDRGDVAVVGSERGPTAPVGPQPSTGSGTSNNQDRRSPVLGDERDADTSDSGRPRRRPRLEDFDRLASVQRTRVAASRAALVQQANLNEEEIAAVDATVGRMNDKLVGYGEEIISQMATEEAPAPAQALGLGHDVSGVLYEGQQELDRILGERVEQVDDEAIEIWNYVDVEQWRPFVEAQLEASGGAQGGPPSGGAAGAGGTPR